MDDAKVEMDDSNEQTRLGLELADSMKQAKATEEQPCFLDPLYDPLAHALNDFADGDGSKLLELLRDSPFRNEYRAHMLAVPEWEPTWQIPRCATLKPMRYMREVHDIIRVIEVKHAAQAALREISDQS